MKTLLEFFVRRPMLVNVIMVMVVVWVFQDRLFFSADDGGRLGRELWVSDGTPEGTHPFKDLAPGPGSASPAWMYPLGNALLFSADDGQRGRELWVSDGTEAGTRLLQELAPGRAGGAPYLFTATRTHVYFFPGASPTGREAWALPRSALERPRRR